MEFVDHAALNYLHDLLSDDNQLLISKAYQNAARFETDHFNDAIKHELVNK